MVNKQLQDVLKQAFKNAGYENENVKVMMSNRPELCDYQCDDCFKLAKQFSKSPKDIAESVVLELNKIQNFNSYFEKVEFAMPGFINLTISNEFINNNLKLLNTTENFGLKTNNQTFFLDYGGPNTAKPLHVGHLRSAIIGESVKRIINFAGAKTISDVHLGDYGLQIGQVIYGLMERNLKPVDITLELLDELYPKISALSKVDEEVKEKCASITKALQDGDKLYLEYWKQICRISDKNILDTYKYLDVSFDLWMGESHAYKHLPYLYEEFQKAGHLVKSEGADVIFINKDTDTKELPPLIFRKSNGAYLYGSTDMATLYERVKDYSPDYLLYFADQRQSLHFEQFFRASEITGILKGAKCEFCGFGTVNGLDGKPYKTRGGDTPKLLDMFDQVKEALTSAKTANEKNTEEDLDIIANAVIKFADLQNSREKDYIFDIQKFSKVVGKTGPYILYTYLRINKVLEAENFLNKDSYNLSLDKIYNKSDRELRLQLLTLENYFTSAFNERKPSFICDFVYNTCTLANAFYENNRIKDEQDLEKKENWLYVLMLTNKIIKSMLDLLIIKIPSVM